MKKVRFTESQMRLIYESYGLDSGGGYLSQVDGSEPDDIAFGDEVFTDPDMDDFDGYSTVVTTDREATVMNPRRQNPLHGTKATTPVYEDIEKQNFIFNKQQKKNAQVGGTKMGKNIASDPVGKSVSNGTQRKRKHDLLIKKQEMDPIEYKRKYGNIENIVNGSLKQMSNKNKAETNISKGSELGTYVNPSKNTAKQSKGHHDGEKTNDGFSIHYYE